MPDYMYQKLEVKVWNNLATHHKKLATHKCVTTQWLRTTALKAEIILNRTGLVGLLISIYLSTSLLAFSIPILPLFLSVC